ncbi:MAG TPA: hypothetical protein VJB87_05430 [Candidatus Nanoarchaeia archaeon]|nr:hypothetical protein [Candidatus Nanoarchaeia archaeon]
MNDNQRIFLAFFVLVVAALNASTDITGQATRGTAAGYAPIAASAASTYCTGKGDLDGDGTYTSEDLIQANNYFSLGGKALRELPESTRELLDVYPVQPEGCGDGYLTQQDLYVLIYMGEQTTFERQRESGAIINQQRCINECREGQETLAPNGYRICGQTDADSCREWVEHQCPRGYQAHQSNNRVLCIKQMITAGQDLLE